jgi:hypothetical protein
MGTSRASWAIQPCSSGAAWAQRDGSHQEEGVTFSHCVPTILQVLLAIPIIDSVDLSAWKVMIGGSALSTALAKATVARGIVICPHGISAAPDGVMPASNPARARADSRAVSGPVCNMDCDMAVMNATQSAWLQHITASRLNIRRSVQSSLVHVHGLSRRGAGLGADGAGYSRVADSSRRACWGVADARVGGLVTRRCPAHNISSSPPQRSVGGSQ